MNHLIERASIGEQGSAIEQRIASLPQGIREGINRSRVAQGMLRGTIGLPACCASPHTGSHRHEAWPATGRR
jgi:hypothetical protein